MPTLEQTTGPRSALVSVPRAVYAGSFDPVTAGHLSVIRRAVGLFGELFVLVAVNPDKQTLFSMEERVAQLREATAHWPTVTCCATTGFVAQFAREHDARYLIRGVRDASDATEESRLAYLNQQLAPEVTTLFVPAQSELSQVSSSGLKALAQAGTDLTGLCPPGVAEQLRERLGPGGSPAPRKERPHVL